MGVVTKAPFFIMLPSLNESQPLYVEGGSESALTPWVTLSPAFRRAAQETPDPDRVERYFVELHSRHPELTDQFEQDPERLRWLALVFLLSHFLSKEVIDRPELLFQISDIHSALSCETYKQRLRGTIPAGQKQLSLARFRRKELLRILLRDGLGLASLASITEEISNLADAVLDEAVRQVIPELENRHGRPLVITQAGVGPAAFTVLALGKLGGRELNYSSDIDLMFLYSGNGETAGPDVITNKEFFKKLGNQITNLLSTYTPAGVCYRVDLRLRPEGRLGEVCTSLAGAKEYYAKRARDWELQMLIKARVAAGDGPLGEELLNFVEPFIYSTTLDFSTIEAMSATRERLGEKLARKRLKSNELDVKLARGGIRDIEFLAQCLQRLHGARDSSVRQTGTLYALSSLLDSDLLSRTEHTQLTEAYTMLRNLEHRLQFEEDRQTHILPTDFVRLEQIARRMPGPDGLPAKKVMNASQLLAVLNQHLENVQVIYERIVHAQRPLYYTPLSDGIVGQLVPSEVRDASQPSAAPAAVNCYDRPPARMRDAEKFAGFLGVVAHTGQGAVLDNNPPVRDYLARIFDLSPFLSERLTCNPELIQQVGRVVTNPGARPVFEGMAAPLSDTDGLRRFYGREMFRILVASACVPEPIFHTLDRLSGLTEFLIARAYRIALEQALAHARKRANPAKPFSDPQNQMMVVALGRLGMREFDVGSDADLLFILPDSEAVRQAFWTRVAERMIEILSSYLGGGPAVSLDTRLRPNGREGLLVQTESTYVDYFANKAEAWEGIAYMKARAVAGDLERATTFLIHLQQVDWRRYGQSGRSREMLRQMRLKLEKEQGSAEPLKAGRGGYYDADFILMYLRLKGAGMFFKSLNTPQRIEVVEKMGHLDRTDAEFLMRATKFFRAIDHATRLVSGTAEERLPEKPEKRQMVAELVQLWTDERPTGKTISSELQALQQQMRSLFDTFFT
ncbi:MAG TPA: glutamine-synthetase adenylyltransferase [Bryobacteraceae bacterium]|nr:glutamine-synthetase adenylyltransferase [Bryobacteraceae bacterium]